MKRPSGTLQPDDFMSYGAPTTCTMLMLQEIQKWTRCGSCPQGIYNIIWDSSKEEHC